MIPLLVIDSHYLCHRAFHTSGHLGWKGKPTGVIFGFLTALIQLKEGFGSDRMVFCFEGRNLKRKQLYPAYKSGRDKERTVEEEKSYRSLRHQIEDLRTVYLPKIGYRNIFAIPGYESDDVMAALAANVPPREDMILVTADSDMYQCLRDNVHIYSPHQAKFYSLYNFTQEHKIRPTQWAVVKAIAGCHGDNVKGVPGIGEKTALKYLRDELPEMSKPAVNIYLGRAIVRRNRPLVELPFAGCPVPTLQPDQIDRRRWAEVCHELGMKSLAEKPPLMYRKT